MKPWSLLAVLLTLPVCSRAAPSLSIDDSDLIGPPTVRRSDLFRETRKSSGAQAFRAQPVVFQIAPLKAPPTRPGTLYGTFLLTDPSGRLFPAKQALALLVNDAGVLAQGRTDENGSWFIQVPDGASGPASIHFRLENSRWSIQDPATYNPYEWEAGSIILPVATPRDLGSFRLDPGSQNGKIGYIHLQFLDAFDLFAREDIATGWWNRTLAVHYPDSSDYFSPAEFSLHLTHPEAWDVNLHEFGHAVMAAGTGSYGGGGPHKIDECYNEGLAWSEGWATFFAGAARLSIDDADAKFQYLVPRRAPIRIENVPDDVCRGDRSEWRVAAGLWDLLDAHPDGLDNFSMSFHDLWNAIQDKPMGGFKDAWRFIRQSLSPDRTKGAEGSPAQNTLLTPSPAAAGKRNSHPLRALSERLAEKPSWDGSGKN